MILQNIGRIIIRWSHWDVKIDVIISGLFKMDYNKQQKDEIVKLYYKHKYPKIIQNLLKKTKYCLYFRYKGLLRSLNEKVV